MPRMGGHDSNMMFLTRFVEVWSIWGEQRDVWKSRSARLRGCMTHTPGAMQKLQGAQAMGRKAYKISVLRKKTAETKLVKCWLQSPDRKPESRAAEKLKAENSLERLSKEVAWHCRFSLWSGKAESLFFLFKKTELHHQSPIQRKHPKKN